MRVKKNLLFFCLFFFLNSFCFCGDVIFFIGPSCSGKSTTTKRLKMYLGCSWVISDLGMGAKATVFQSRDVSDHMF